MDLSRGHSPPPPPVDDANQEDPREPREPREPQEPHETALPQAHQSPTHLAHPAESVRLSPSAHNGRPPAGRPASAPRLNSSWATGSGSSTSNTTPAASSNISEDRVFPIRSVISVDPTNFPKIARAEQEPDLPESDTQETLARRLSHHRTPADWDLGSTPPPPSSSRHSPSQSRRRAGAREPVPTRRPNAHRYTSGPALPLQRALDLAVSGRDGEESGTPGREGAAAPFEEEPFEERGRRARSTSTSHQDASQAAVPHVTTRFTHVLTDEGHAVITGPGGNHEHCDDEPIHTPGAVQGFGCLVALQENDDGLFTTRYVSENSARFLGYTPQQLFRLKDFLCILSEEQQENVLDHIDVVRDEDADPAANGPEVFSLSVRPPIGRTIKLWCAVHINDAHPDLLIFELELVDDAEYPTRPPEETALETPSKTIPDPPPAQVRGQGTERLSRPLRILRSARRRRGDQGAMQVFDIMSLVQEQLSSAENIETLLKVVVGIVKELTGFHRVMMYQFDPSFNGEVVAEIVDPAHSKDSYQGLHFPASDIPRQARELYKLNKVRLLYDRDQETARIVCRTREDLETPLDMSHSYLRAMSPIHLKYLANMAVRSSMSISLSPFNDLWGLIMCHSYANHGMRVSFPIRKMCRLVGDTASRSIERLSYASRLQARKLINTVPTDKNPSGYIIASSDDLLRLFDADFGLVAITGETKMLGTLEHSQEALAMLEYLRVRKLTSVFASNDCREDFTDLNYPPGFQAIAGLLYVPLSAGGNDFIVFFRKGQVREVKWAGNPYEKATRDGTAGYLEPRSSFEIWTETVIGKCREWDEEQVETASVLCLVYGKFIDVWRQKEQALQSSKLTRLLLSNSAHEVRTPLNAIINYLEIALEGAVDQETRDNLSRSYSASKSLIYVINDLLDLTNTEEGRDLAKDEVFDLHVCIEEATGPFRIDAQRKNIDYEVVQHAGLPRFVQGDSRRVRQAISNMTANAVEYTKAGSVKVEIFVAEIRDRQAVVDFVVSDSGMGMSPSQLDSLFHDLEQVSPEEPSPSPSSEITPRKSMPRTLGLGLAIVARTVRTMGGQLRLKSEDGQGSRFVVELPFDLPEMIPPHHPGESQESVSGMEGDIGASAAPLSVTVTPNGEITLVDHGANEEKNQKAASDRGSVGSRRSLESGWGHQSQKSDADRLIDAIQTPLSLDNREPLYPVSPESTTGMPATAPPGVSLPTSPSSASARPHQILPKSKSPSRSHAEVERASVVDIKAPVCQATLPDDRMGRDRVRGRAGSLVTPCRQTRPRTSTDPHPEIVASLDMGRAARKLRVLIAEDDPVNLQILRKRLERAGHEVYHAVNGEDCAAMYKEQSHTFDVVLMDMQMPIVDGLTSTERIRSFENSTNFTPPDAGQTSGRVPIFAVSASLAEEKRQVYIKAGFDGWVLKPIDFRRLNTLLSGIYDAETRNACLYEEGEWERGGWLSVKYP